MRKARGGIKRNKEIQQSTRRGTHNNTRIRAEGVWGSRGSRMGKEEGNEGNGDDNDAKERSAARSSVSSSSEKEAEEP